MSDTKTETPTTESAVATPVENTPSTEQDPTAEPAASTEQDTTVVETPTPEAAARAQRLEEIKRRRTARVPNVRPKTEDREKVFDRKMLEENLAKMQAAATIVVKDETDEEKTMVFESKDGKAEELKQVPTLYFKNCSNGNYTINRRIKNLFVQGCRNCTFNINLPVLTRTCEIWRGGDLTFNVNTELKTLQLDILSNVHVTYDRWENFHTLIYNQLENLELKFLNGPEHDIVTGFTQMSEQKGLTDSNVTDQFIIRFLDGVLTPERCIRLKNGHLSTEREAIEWERRNERARDNYMQKFMKEAGIALGRDSAKTQKVRPNALCPCGSNRKYKRCCSGKKQVTGLATSEKNISYRA